MIEVAQRAFDEVFDEACGERASEWIADLRRDGAPISSDVENLMRMAFGTGYACGISDERKLLERLIARRQARQEEGE